ncbi:MULTISPECIES: helix-turn-helix domain-containing protein [unclassified Brenneria]|uniref:AraC-like ligand-binding domain-containing protein n=1 Tax=unclassified Brenneria TaxID=2634434 RepID=UPI0015524166|nr:MULTISPECIES: helix-turn-helix domain-containing protein [unclassified Brenneria]MBJ7220803.1 helix-turn-helix domain-containing protein [Brenneria sp. L3-3C-1]MEE3642043.1 helix-turn-helix domain-containing protein [Brenneria sp. L3_3C_1]MEE3649260.1 helix-turn-helix domain-containing protein [Brenneria sp. HEZEL_4_2_4]NPC99213.1 helix-turn-helix domain-containing protein [Brenneria sp. hezel4-2-4]
MSITYSTAHISEKQRFEYWKEVVCSHCLLAKSEPLGSRSFDASMQFHSAHPMAISTLSAPAHQWKRSAEAIRKGPDDDLWLALIQHGQAWIEQNGRQAVLSPGSMVIYDSAREFDFRIDSQALHLLRIPRHLLAARFPKAEHLTAITLDASRPGIVPLREMLLQARSESVASVNPNTASRFFTMMLDMLAFSLEIDASQEHLSGSRNLYEKVMRFIRNHLQDETLSLESIAKAHYVSSRTLTRAFAIHQKTPMSAVWHERLLASRCALEEGRVHSVSQAALEYGFKDFSHFSRAFRRTFGQSPNTLLMHTSFK